MHPAHDDNQEHPKRHHVRLEAVSEETSSEQRSPIEELSRLGGNNEESEVNMMGGKRHSHLGMPSIPVSVEAATSSNSGWIWVVLAFIVGISAGIGGTWAFMNAGNREIILPKINTKSMGQGGNIILPSATPLASPTTTPEPTLPAANIKRSDLNVRVLNGSGVAGAASKLSASLSGLGYKIAGSANADSDDYLKYKISIKEDKKEFVEMLKKDLGSSVEIDLEVGVVAASASYDAIVIIGQ